MPRPYAFARMTAGKSVRPTRRSRMAPPPKRRLDLELRGSEITRRIRRCENILHKEKFNLGAIA